MDAGFTTLKTDPLKRYHLNGSITREEEKQAMGVVAAIREAIGDDLDFAIDCHRRFNFHRFMGGVKYPYRQVQEAEKLRLGTR